MIIKNGVGDGTLCRVYDNNHLAAQAISEQMIGYKSRVEQRAFSMGCPHATPWAVATSETSPMILYNGEPEKSFVLSTLYLGFNGGTASGNKVLYGKMYKSASAPTTGIYGSVAIPFGNINLGSSKITSMSAYLWDNSTGTGLTGGSAGSPAFFQIISSGLNVIDFNGSVVISPGQYLRLTTQCAEAALVTVTISGYLADLV